ncbi:TraX family protein [Listeria valentina]|uniref:TraX family protein n=1 Tax=Listeria valentina TaxID=2705293 RepID=UPI0014314F2F|nr:TraX family protein [Listeria valentina]
MNANQLKLSMMFLMILDHIEPLLTYYEYGSYLSVAFGLLTRCVAPIFAFMAVEGFYYTRSRAKYLFRLYGAAIVMFLGNTLLNHTVGRIGGVVVENNIFLTLAVGVTILGFVEIIQKKKGKLKKVFSAISVVLLCSFGLFLTEGGIVVIPFMLISYFYREKWKIRDIGYFILAGFLFYFEIFSGLQVISWQNIWNMIFAGNYSFMIILAIPFIRLYNGKKGSTKKFYKYLFYVFYPVHLWLITIVANLIGK